MKAKQIYRKYKGYISSGKRHQAMNMRESLAELAHEQWSGWMEYLFSKGTFNEDGTWTMPEWAVNRWVIQMGMPYNRLSEEEKESDRKEADKFLGVISQEINSAKYDYLGRI